MGTGFPRDVVHRDSSVDRDCRQAMARFLLLPANWDVLRRLVGLIVAERGVARGGGGDSAGAHARRVFNKLRDPGVVGPELAREVNAFLGLNG